MVNRKKKKAVLLVLDSLGIGGAHDAGDFGDEGADTFVSIVKEVPNLNIPNLTDLGFCNISGIEVPWQLPKSPKGAYGRAAELSAGKDTTTGHWEMMGIKTTVPFKTYPDGFPQEFIDLLSEKTGRKFICNFPASGTKIIEEYGDEHEESGAIILYTSADSVCQLAANTDIVPLEELYSICRIARELLVGDWACGRVIARPYVKLDGKRVRTSDRKDYSVDPPEATTMDLIKDAGKTVYGVGKIHDIFNGQGLTDSIHTDNNRDGVMKTIEALAMDFEGLIFTNLVDFDSKYGHRRNPQGYGKAIEEFDSLLPQIIGAMGKEDLLIMTADHGNDPTFEGTDHTRENVFVLAYSPSMDKGVQLPDMETFADVGATVADFLKVEKKELGRSFLCML